MILINSDEIHAKVVFLLKNDLTIQTKKDFFIISGFLINNEDNTENINIYYFVFQHNRHQQQRFSLFKKEGKFAEQKSTSFFWKQMKRVLYVTFKCYLFLLYNKIDIHFSFLSFSLFPVCFVINCFSFTYIYI